VPVDQEHPQQFVPKAREKYFERSVFDDDEKKARAKYNSKPIGGREAYKIYKATLEGDTKVGKLMRVPLSPDTTVAGEKGSTSTSPSPIQPKLGGAGGTGGTQAGQGPEEVLPEGVDDLIQLNIEAIDARYCDDIK